MNSTEWGEETRKLMMEEIIRYFDEHGYAPSIREIGKLVGLASTSSVHRQLQILIKRGLIETDADWNTPRAFRVKGYKFVRDENGRIDN